jgi:hypothetical protein
MVQIFTDMCDNFQVVGLYTNTYYEQSINLTLKLLTVFYLCESILKESNQITFLKAGLLIVATNILHLFKDVVLYFEFESKTHLEVRTLGVVVRIYKAERPFVTFSSDVAGIGVNKGLTSSSSYDAPGF